MAGQGRLGEQAGRAVSRSSGRRAKGWRRPAAWLYHPAALLVGLGGFLLFGVRIRRDPAVARLRGPLIVLGNHPSFLDPFFLAPAIWPRRVNFVTAHGYFRSRFLGACLRKLGAVPKIQFSSDMQAMRQMLAILHGSGSLAIFPEGQRSLDGASQPLDDAIAKLVKKEGCPVVGVVANGAYLTWPRWSASGARPGRIEIKTQVMLTREDIRVMSVPDIQARIELALSYQDYDWQKSRPRLVRFRSRAPALGLHDICHQCPACGRDLAMQSGSDQLTCRFCGNAGRMDQHGLLSPVGGSGRVWPDVRAWHLWQLADLARRISQPGFELVLPAALSFPAEDGTIRPGGHGSLRLADGVIEFRGADQEAGDIDLSFAVSQLRGVSAHYGQYFELVHAERIYRFSPDPGQAVVLLIDALGVCMSSRRHSPPAVAP